MKAAHTTVAEAVSAEASKRVRQFDPQAGRSEVRIEQSR